MLLYNLFIYILIGCVKPISFFFPKVKKFFLGRKAWKQDLLKWRSTISENEAIIWFHVASLGEYDQGKPLMDKIITKHQVKVLLTFFSPSGYEVVKKEQTNFHVAYLPLDTKANAQQFIAIVNPKLVVFVKYEFWYNFINEIAEQNIPMINISTILRPNQIFFKPWGGFFKKGLQKFNKMFVQNKETLVLLTKHKISTPILAGDTRCDRVIQKAQQCKSFPLVQQFKGDCKLIVVGSCWPEDLDVILDKSVQLVLNDPQLKFVFAPHEITPRIIHCIQSAFENENIPVEKLTHKSARIEEASVLILDTIGQLFDCYQYATLVFIGGGYKDGLHNILEPGIFGNTILFGNKKYHKFQEAIDLVKQGTCIPISDPEDFTDKVKQMLYTSPSLLAKYGKGNKNYILQSKGASQTILLNISKYLL